MIEREPDAEGWIEQMKRNHARWIAMYVEAQRAHVLALMAAKDRPLPAPATPQEKKP